MSDEVVVKKKRVLTLEQRARLRETSRAWKARNPKTAEQKASHTAYTREWRKAHPPTLEYLTGRAEYSRAYRLSIAPQKSDNPLAAEDLRKARRVKARSLYQQMSPERRAARLSRLAVWKENNAHRLTSYSQNNRARRCGAEGTFTPADIKSLLKTQHGVCLNCQAMLIKRGEGKFHIDHIMPIALGGSNWPDNLQLLCPPCNLSKSDKHPDVWMADNPRKRDVGFIPF